MRLRFLKTVQKTPWPKMLLLLLRPASPLVPNDPGLAAVPCSDRWTIHWYTAPHLVSGGL